MGVKRSNRDARDLRPYLLRPPEAKRCDPPKLPPKLFFLIQSSAAIGGVTLFKFIQVFMIGPPLIIHE